MTQQRTQLDIPSLIHANALLGAQYLDWAQKAETYQRAALQLQERLGKVLTWAEANSQKPLVDYVNGVADSLPRTMVMPEPEPEPQPEQPQPKMVSSPLPLRDSARMPNLQAVDPRNIL